MNGSRSDRPDGLRRFVARVGQGCPLNADGFLNSQPVGWPLQSADPPLSVEALLHCTTSYVLLGQGGAGKSTTLRALCQGENGVFLDLGTCSVDHLEARLNDAVAAGRPVFLDGVDQFASGVSAPLKALAQLVVKASEQGLQVRLGCRPALWKASIDAMLSSALPGFRVWNLCPLDRDTATEIVTGDAGDGAGFIDALVAARRARISALPQKLRTMAKYWRVRGELPDSQRAAVTCEIDDFLAEHDDERPFPLSAGRALNIACRLGALATFTDTAVFALGPALDGARGIDRLPDEAEPDMPAVRVAPEDYAHVLGTGLFEAAGPGVVAFRHQQYSEYLAAKYLLDRKVAVSRTRQLLDVHPHSGIIPAARIGVAAWLLALDPGLLGELIDANAEALIESGVEVHSGEIRAELVRAFLSQVVEGGVAPDWGLDLSVVSHAGLSGRLEGVLDAEEASETCLWWVARLAVAGGCRDLASRLVPFAKDASRSTALRRTLVFSIGGLGDQAALASLSELLPASPQADVSGDLLAALIDVLYPALVGLERLLPLLGPGPGLDASDRDRSLGVIAGRFGPDDLPQLLAWLVDQTVEEDTDWSLDRLFAGVVLAAWKHSGQDQVFAALADLLATSALTDQWLQRHDGPVPWDNGPASRRRDLILAVTRRVEADEWHRIIDSRLVVDDVPWLLDELPSMPPEVAGPLAKCVGQLAHNPTLAAAERILRGR